MELTAEIASRFAQAALGHVAREYPHKLDHAMDGDADVLPPRELHPCFFGSFDWHSCVHGWWTLLTLRRLFPDLPEATAITQLAEATFTSEKIAVELAYAQRPAARGFERPYGWAWLLYLHYEAARQDDRKWAERLEPLARHFAQAFKQYLSVLTYPVFVGTHYNTAFALVLAREWAEQRDAELVSEIDEWSHEAFAHRRDYRGWEPGGDEFLSPVLSASLLMRQTMPDRFAPWFAGLVLDNGWLAALEPATVSDRSDGKVAHLDGLNLSRAWALREIAGVLRYADDRDMLHRKAKVHLDAALPQVTGDYMGEHWLASFALLALLASE